MAANPIRIFAYREEKCCECGVVFASPVLDERLKDKRTFYCPNGHAQHYLGECLEQTVARLERELARKTSAESKERARADIAESKVRQFISGRCPECRQTFRRLREHMKREHPGYKPGKGGRLQCKKG